jgi:hypothetical protein
VILSVFRFFFETAGYIRYPHVFRYLVTSYTLFPEVLMTDTHLHRSHHNLKAFRSAFAIHNDLYWVSRSFPVRLDFSLTRPMRTTSMHIAEEIEAAWRSRHDLPRFDVHIARAQEEAALLDQYLLRAREEDVLSMPDYLAFTTRIESLQLYIRRLPRQVSIAA